MTTFHQREAAVEDAFAYHQDSLFEVRAHGFKNFATWAPSEMGQSPDEATTCVDYLLATLIQEEQVTAIFADVRNEFEKAGRVVSDRSLIARSDGAVTKAIAVANIA